jgi:phospholipid-translocating ATPase
MLVAFGLCHNVIIEEDGKGGSRFNASSPDELAFINMAKCCRWEYTGLNRDNELCLQTPQGEIRYKILHTIEFDSDRKRMSVILQRDGRVFVYCKGADNVILKRLRSQNSKRCRVAAERVEEWSQEGLRTLLFAKREVERKDY